MRKLTTSKVSVYWASQIFWLVNEPKWHPATWTGTRFWHTDQVTFLYALLDWNIINGSQNPVQIPNTDQNKLESLLPVSFSNKGFCYNWLSQTCRLIILWDWKYECVLGNPYLIQTFKLTSKTYMCPKLVLPDTSHSSSRRPFLTQMQNDINEYVSRAEIRGDDIIILFLRRRPH